MTTYSYKPGDPYYRSGFESPWEWAERRPCLSADECICWAMWNAHNSNWDVCFWLIEASLYAPEYRFGSGLVAPPGFRI